MTSLQQSNVDLILWDVIEEHFDEAAFLFEQWERALHSPKFTLTALSATLERRMEAHLDGLLVGGSEVVKQVLYPNTTNADEPAKVSVAALTLLHTNNPGIAECLIQSALQSEEPVQRAIARALILADLEPLNRMLLEHFQGAATELEKAFLLEILTSRGVDAIRLLGSHSDLEDPRLISAVLDAAGIFGHRGMVRLAEMHIGSNQSTLRASAVKAGTALGSHDAMQRCRQLVQDPKEDDPTFALLITILGIPEDYQILYSQLEVPTRAVSILWSLGFAGTLQAGNACLLCLENKDERVAKAAAEAMAWIGGLELNDKRFQNVRTELTEDQTLPPFEEDNLETDLGIDGVDDLPVPNGEAIAQLWKEQSGQMRQDQRYLLGRPYSPESVSHALEVGSMWRRHGVAMELSFRSGGTRHVSTDAFSSRQRRQIAALVSG